MPQCEAFSLCPRTVLEPVPLSTVSTPLGGRRASAALSNLGRAAASGHCGELRAEAGPGVRRTELRVSYCKGFRILQEGGY